MSVAKLSHNDPSDLDGENPAQEAPSCQEALLEQFTQSLEEAAWLRRLAGHFEFRDVRHSLRQVAGEVLPELRQIVAAETVGLIPTCFANQDQVASDAEPLWTSHPIDGATVRQILNRYCQAVMEQPVVLNQEALASGPMKSSGIQALIIVRVASGDHHIGWLLAVNRDSSRRAIDSLTNPAWALEFGTVEASLVQAAAAMLATHARNVALFEDKQRLLIGVISAMSQAVDARDPYTRGHSERVATYSRTIGQSLGLAADECERIHVAGLLHDIGKIGVPDEVLKKEGKLTDHEFAVIKQHPEMGYHILHKLAELAYVLPGVLHHHERYDGQGYPHCLAGEEIPLMARVLAVADSYDAMTSCRPYRNAMPSGKAESILREGAGSQWDASIVEAFFRSIDEIRRLAAGNVADRMHQALASFQAPAGSPGSD